MVRFSDRMGALFRDYTGSQQKIEELKRKTGVYLDIEQTVDYIEQTAISSLENKCDTDWMINKAGEKRFEYQYIHGEIDRQDYVTSIRHLEDEREKLLAYYIDSDETDVEISSSKNRLIRIKNDNSRLPGISDMDFDTWVETKKSAEVAKTMRVEIENGADYMRAEEVANKLWSYKRNRHLKR